jgi:cytochrome c heme-lyase
VPEEFRHAAVYNVYNQRIDGSSAAEGSTAADLLDPTNNMPLQPNQQPCPGQRKLLSTERLQSNIPKGGTSSTWLYPSPQMFYNGAAATGAAAAGSACRLPPPVQRACAPRKCTPLPPRRMRAALKRKGKGSDVAEDDMDSVVHAHNSMNEATWQRVQAWEALHRARCGQAQLLRFRGRPDDLRCADSSGGGGNGGGGRCASHS